MWKPNNIYCLQFRLIDKIFKLCHMIQQERSLKVILFHPNFMIFNVILFDSVERGRTSTHILASTFYGTNWI